MRVTAPASNVANSPVPSAMTDRTIPPSSIWSPVATSGRRGRTARCDANSDPVAQHSGDSRQKTRPTGSSAPTPPTIDGAARTATPTKPTMTPRTASRGSRSPRKIPPSTATQIGIVAMSRAAIPDGTVSSPKATKPMPPPRSSAPTIALSRTSRRVGMTNERRSRATDQVRRIRPASRKRIAAMTNGGIVSTATEMPRYVDPQTR